MGCDIHQFNYIYQSDGTYLFEGEGIGDINKEYKFNGKFYEPGSEDSFYSSYHSDYIPEIVPGRNYQLFGMLAEVRGDDYAIDDYYKHTGYPEPFVEDRASYVLTVDKHSPTWYTFKSLKEGLTEVVEKMDKDLKILSKIYSSKNQDGDDLSDEEVARVGEEYDDVEWLRNRAVTIISQLDEARKIMTGEQFRKSIILFDFDS